jgi:serine/threonine protein kinase
MVEKSYQRNEMLRIKPSMFSSSVGFVLVVSFLLRSAHVVQGLSLPTDQASSRTRPSRNPEVYLDSDQSHRNRAPNVQGSMVSDETRRRMLEKSTSYPFVFLQAGILSLFSMPATVSHAHSITEDGSKTTKIIPYPQPSGFGIVSDAIISSLVYERVLGKGSYKVVYLVSGLDSHQKELQFALAVERLRFKGNVKDALRGVQIAEDIQRSLSNPNDKQLFEQILAWWIQSSALPEFARGRTVFNNLNDRTQKAKTRFAGSKWFVSLKPVYDMDLKRFVQKTTALARGVVSRSSSDSQKRKIALHSSSPIAGLPLTEEAAIKFLIELCRAGKLMHAFGLVHRDIKPKNVMISNGRPVLIDFGFSGIGSVEKDGKICLVEPGVIKGEVRYVRGDDVALYRGCQEGDLYAAGKTMYELLFGAAETLDTSGIQSITEFEATYQNERFRNTIISEEAGTSSRFALSPDACDLILSVIRDLCKYKGPISFGDAEQRLLIYQKQS